MAELLRITPQDNVAVALTALSSGQTVTVDGITLTTVTDVPAGHKVALFPIKAGEKVIKYGFPIGYAKEDIPVGAHVHVHNLHTVLSGELTYEYHPTYPTIPEIPAATFMGYPRKDGRVGVRNELWILPTVGCVNDIARQLERAAQELVGGGVECVCAFPHPYGCSQMGDDQENTRTILADLATHPNVGGVLVLGLGCENSSAAIIEEHMGDYDKSRVRFLVCQQVEDEFTEAMKLLRELANNMRDEQRVPCPASKLVIGLKCGGSDGFSGITANPVIGGFSDLLCGMGGTTILTEVPEMFGAETILMDRCNTPELFDKTVRLINDFKRYFEEHHQTIYENPSPGNKAGGKLNDVYNAGELNFTGDVTLDGGIAGNGTTTFAKDTVLTVKTGTTTISNDVVNKGATLSLVFANGYAGGEYDLITEEGSLDKEFNIAQNALYNIKANENGSYTISKKTAGDFVASTGANVNQANTISAVAGSKTGSARFDAVAERIGGLIQSAHASDVQTALNAATALAPEVAPMVTQSESQTVNQVFGAVSTRLSGGAIAAAGEAGAEGVSSGDNVFERVAMWIQGMFNRSELDDTAKTKGFDADSAGVAMGLEKRVNDQVKLGIGYAYTNTDIDGFMRSTDVDTHTAILYGEYKPSAWFVNGVVSYGWSDYSESKNVAGYNVNADYDATSLGLQAMTGYEMQVKGFNLTPEAGLRYVHTSQDAYTDTVDQRVSANDSDILTGVIGAKADREFTLENEMTLRPEVRVALTYDMFNDAGGSVVTLANGAAYRVDGEALDRFGVELGAGLTAEVNDNVELSLRYEGQFRDDYTDHTGLLNAKYKF